MLILNGFAVDEEAAVMVEVECSGVQGQNRFWGRRGGRRWVVELSGWGCRLGDWGCGERVRSFAALPDNVGAGRMTSAGRGCLCGLG